MKETADCKPNALLTFQFFFVKQQLLEGEAWRKVNVI